MKIVTILGILCLLQLGLFGIYSFELYHEYQHVATVMGAPHIKTYWGWLRTPGSLTYRH